MASVQQQLPEARQWITGAINEAAAAGLSPETITATLFIEALGRQWTQHGSLGLAVMLSNLSAKFAATVAAPETIN
jgi:hypothetical protein